MKILPTPEIVFGEAAINTLPEVLGRLGARNTLLVTDKGLVRAGLCDKLRGILASAGHAVAVYDEVAPDPTIRQVLAVSALARDMAVDSVIGLGGGSSIDVAKVVAALMTNTKPIAAYFGTGLLEFPALPIIAVPTTAGTGSEVTPIAILSDEDEQLKKGIVSTSIIPRYAFLDPAFTASMPPKITAMTGIDALCHAIEAYTSVNAIDYTDALALRAIRLLSGSIREAFEQGGNLVVRGNMLMGSLLAGMAFANAGVTAVHAFAYPLGGMFHVPHGLANSMMLPTIMNYNRVGNEKRFAEVAGALTGRDGSSAGTHAGDAVAAVRELFRVLDMPRGLEAVGVPEAAVPELAQGAMKVTRLLANNPRPITLDDAVKLYAEAFRKD